MFLDVTLDGEYADGPSTSLANARFAQDDKT
jgi:hypothetical protein